MPNFSLGGILCCFINFGKEKIWITEEGDIKICHRIFLSHSAEHFRRGEPFGVSLNSGIEKVWITEEGDTKIFRPKNFVSQH